MRKLPLSSLYERHPGLTRALAETLVEAAGVCLSRHHSAPSEITIQDNGQVNSCGIEWEEPDVRTSRAWANEIDTTEAGACGVSLAALEMQRGLVTVSRAETRTGADYYVAPIGHSGDDLEDCLRLEVSGIDKCTPAAVNQRLAQKVKQAAAGASNLPAVASVVGFSLRAVAIADVDNAL